MLQDGALLKVSMSDDWLAVISLNGILINLFPCLAELISFGSEAEWVVLFMVVKRVISVAILSDSIQVSVIANP